MDKTTMSPSGESAMTSHVLDKERSQQANLDIGTEFSENEISSQTSWVQEQTLTLSVSKPRCLDFKLGVKTAWYHSKNSVTRHENHSPEPACCVPLINATVPGALCACVLICAKKTTSLPPRNVERIKRMNPPSTPATVTAQWALAGFIHNLIHLLVTADVSPSHFKSRNKEFES